MENKFFLNSQMISPLCDAHKIKDLERFQHSRETKLSQCTFVSNKFQLDEVTGDEILRISAFGLYKCFINNKNVTKDILTPGWVNYADRLPYQTYNISKLLDFVLMLLDLIFSQ